MIKIKSMYSKDVPGLLEGIHHDQQTEDIINLNKDKVSKNELLNQINGKVVYKILDDKKYGKLHDKLDKNDPDYDKQEASLLQLCTYTGDVDLSDLVKRTMELNDEFTLIHIKDLNSYEVEDYEDVTKLCRSAIYSVDNTTVNNPIKNPNKLGTLINSRLDMTESTRIHQILIGTSEMYARLVTYKDFDEVESTEWQSIGGGGGNSIELDETQYPFGVKDRVFGIVNNKLNELYRVNYFVYPDKVVEYDDFLHENYIIIDDKFILDMRDNHKVMKFIVSKPKEEIILLIHYGNEGASTDRAPAYRRYTIAPMKTNCIYVVLQSSNMKTTGSSSYMLVISDTPPHTINTPEQSISGTATYAGLSLWVNKRMDGGGATIEWSNSSLHEIISYSLSSQDMDFPKAYRKSIYDPSYNWSNFVSSRISRYVHGIIEYAKSSNLDITVDSIQYKITPTRIKVRAATAAGEDFDSIEQIYEDDTKVGGMNVLNTLYISDKIANEDHFNTPSGIMVLPQTIDDRYEVKLKFGESCDYYEDIKPKLPLGAEITIFNKITGKEVTKRELHKLAFDRFDNYPTEEDEVGVKISSIPFISAYGMIHLKARHNFEYLFTKGLKKYDTVVSKDIVNSSKTAVKYVDGYETKYKDLIKLNTSKLTLKDDNGSKVGYFELEFTMPYGENYLNPDEYIYYMEDSIDEKIGRESRRPLNRVVVNTKLPANISIKDMKIDTIIGGTIKHKEPDDDWEGEELYVTGKLNKNQLLINLPSKRNFLSRDNGVIKFGVTLTVSEGGKIADFPSQFSCDIQQSDGTYIVSFNDIKLAE